MAYNMPGIVVDGQDVLAVHEAVNAAVERARSGDGPSLIECKTFRMRGHAEGVPDVKLPYAKDGKRKRKMAETGPDSSL